MLRCFVNVRKTSLSEESNLKANVTLRLRHAHHLIVLLFKHLHHHRFSSAAQLMPALATCYYWAPDLVGKCGVETLLHDEVGYHEALQLYKQLFLHSLKLREEFFLEMVFFLVSHGNVEEAFEMFQDVINQDPFRSNPLCRGYCGLLAFMMSRKEKDRKQAEEEEEDMLGSSLGQRDSLYGRQAEQQWREMIQLMPGKVGVMDSFIHKYWQLLMELGREKESLDLLQFYRDLYPNHINAHRYLLCHINTTGAVYTTDGSFGDLRVDCLKKLAELDPSCEEVLHLVEHCLQQHGTPKYSEIFLHLLHYLDYPHNGHSETFGWSLLSTVMQKWPAYKTCSQWICRLSWWRKLYSYRVAVFDKGPS